jgi:hypothetical protein
MHPVQRISRCWAPTRFPRPVPRLTPKSPRLQMLPTQARVMWSFRPHPHTTVHKRYRIKSTTDFHHHQKRLVRRGAFKGE